MIWKFSLMEVRAVGANGGAKLEFRIHYNTVDAMDVVNNVIHI